MEPALIIKNRGEIVLSGESLTELMRAVLAKGKLFRFKAKGFSMSPFIKDGDVVTVRPLSGAAPRTGDVVAFLLPSTGRTAVHRVVGAGAEGYFVKGDNTLEADGIVPLDKIMGIVVRVERDGQRVKLGTSRGGAVVARLSRSGLLSRALQTLRRASRRTRS